MARIVLASWGSYGDAFPYLGLARALKARGHHPVLMMPEHYRPLAAREALAFQPLAPDVNPDDRALIGRLMHPARGTEVIIRELLIPALRNSVEQVRAVARDADLIVTHPVTFAGPLAAEALGRRWISTVLAPISFFSAHDLPALPPMPRLVHLRRLGTWWGRAMVWMAHALTSGWVEPVQTLRAELGLPRGRHPIYEGQFSPHGTLALFSRLLAAPQPDWPPHVRITGFVFYNGLDTLDPELESFLTAGPPPVVFTLGSSAVGAPGRFYEESVRAAERLGVRAVVMIGPYEDNRPAGPLASDVWMTGAAPHDLLFPRASAIVHQGGIGTTGQALRSGRPMIVVPHAHDQPDNAFRVAKLGVSRTILPTHYSAPRVARELARLLGNERYRIHAAESGEVVRREGGAEAAADAVDALLSGPRQ